jgi:hypothetical protein
VQTVALRVTSREESALHSVLLSQPACQHETALPQLESGERQTFRALDSIAGRHANADRQKCRRRNF